MSSPEIPDSGRRLRLPRKGDKVVAAPFSGKGCVEGVVVSYAQNRLSVQTETKHGIVHPEFSRFTWSKKRKAWICWPLDVSREVKNWDKIEDRLIRKHPVFAEIGDYVRFSNGRGGWVLSHICEPNPMDEIGAVFQSLKAYIVSHRNDTMGFERLEIAATALVYNSEERIWCRT